MIANQNSGSPPKFHLPGFSTDKLKHVLIVAIVLLSVLAIIWQVVKVNAGLSRIQALDLLTNSPVNVKSILVEPEASVAEAPGAYLETMVDQKVAFKTQNGRTIQGTPPVTKEIPQLVLYRNGVLTAPEERTVTLNVRDILVPPTGVRVTLRIETQHPDPDLGGGFKTKIPVWQASQWIANTSGVIEIVDTVSFTHEFGKTVLYQSDPVPTPTDYFRYEVIVTSKGHPITDPLQEFAEDFAFLMENQSIAQLPELREASTGVAPQELVVHYTDMFPFQRDIFDPESRLPRAAVRDYVETQLVPNMVEAVQVQVNAWEFPWRQAGSSYRPGEGDRRLSVALTQGGTWFHGRSPSTAHSGISINVESKDLAAYDTLTEGIIAYFHHELFHILQRNLNLDAGWNGDVDGEHEEWAFITEGTAVMASSVAQPRAEFGLAPEKRAYMSKANVFLAGDEFYSEDLNTSYRTIDPYRASIYWRFLYDQYSRAYGGPEDQAIGMQVIRETLNALYSSAKPEVSPPNDLVRDLPAIMDQALANVSGGPFRSFEDSLIHFAGAVYALRLEDGRWDGAGKPIGTLFYDPNKAYAAPPAETISFAGSRQVYSDGIGNSFGLDFVEVALDPKSDGTSLTIQFSTQPESTAQFNLQVWKLIDLGNRQLSRLVAGRISAPEVVTQVDAQGNLIYTIVEIDTQTFNRLGLIVTRIDPNEALDSTGAYTITLH